MIWEPASWVTALEDELGASVTCTAPAIEEAAETLLEVGRVTVTVTTEAETTLVVEVMKVETLLIEVDGIDDEDSTLLVEVVDEEEPSTPVSERQHIQLRALLS